MKRPTWFVPIRGFGEWAGFIAGIIALVATVWLVVWGVGRISAGKVGLATFGFPRVFFVRFENNLGRPVVVAHCRSSHSATCSNPVLHYSIAPGESAPDVYVSSLGAEWAVEAPDGTLLRCVVIPTHHGLFSTQHVRLSDAPLWADPCPRDTPITTR